ncbi:MAG: RHS repeat-associated core domain-containing protein [Pirellulaceae bacterium]
MGNTAWRLLDSYGVEIFNQGFSDVDTRILHATGNYTLLVEGYYHDTGTGSYTINVQPIAPVVPQALTLGSTVNETIAVAGEQDVYQFTLAAAANLYFDSLSVNGNLNWTLTGPAGTTVNQRSFTGSDWFTSLQGLLNLLAGNYSLTIDGSGDTAGDYSFRLLNLGDAEILTPGTAVSGTLSPHNETDAYRFAATAGDRFFFDVQTSTDMGNTAWRLLDPYGVEIFNQGFSDVDTRILQATGNYTLLVEGYYHDSGIGSYTINVQPIAPVVPQALTLGSTVSETLAVPGEQNVYQFTLAAASNLYFDSLSVNGNLNWTLTGPAGTTVNPRSFTGSDWFASLQGLLNLPAGDYTLTIDGSGDTTGDYSFRLLNLADAEILTPGTAVSGTLSPHNETDAYRFAATAGDRFFFDVQTSTDMGNTAWRLLDSYGVEIFNQGFSDVDTRILQATGNYTLLVEGYYHDTDIGSYTVNVQPIAPAVPQALTLGSTVNETIAISGEQDVYQFTLAAASNLYFDSLSVNGNLNWTLTGPAGTTVNQRSFTGSDWFTSLQGLLNLPAGDYTLTIDGSGDTTGDYSFRLLNLADAGILTPGTAVSGTLSPHNETDAYRFAATAGDRVFFDVQTSTDMGNTAWRLLDPYGVEIFNQGFSDVDTRILQATGNYTLLVEGYYHDTDIGSYTVNVQPVAPAMPQAVTLGGTVNETIAVPGEQDVYQFALASASNLYFDSLSVNGNLNWTLTGPAGTTVNQRPFTSSDWFASLQGLLNLPAGDYTLTIDGSGDTTGDYSFRLLNLADAEILTPGTAVGGTLSPHNETDAYRFAATAGDRFFFDVQTSTDMGNTAWRLLDPYGVEIFNQYFSDVDARILQATGNYTLLAEGYYHDTGTGSYTVNVEFQGNSPPTSPTGTALTPGTIVSESIDTAGEQDPYAFTLASASNLYFDSLSVNGNLNWTLTGPAGTTVNPRSFTGSDWFASLQGLLNLPAGDYTLTIDGSGDTTGDYSFRLLNLGDAEILTPGTAVSGTLSPHNETDAYRFAATAGDRFFFDVQTSTDMGNTAWRLLDPYGVEIFNQGFSDVDTRILQATGNYTLLVEGYYHDTDIGSYTVNVQPIAPAVPQALTLGSTVNETIAISGEQDVYQFTLAAASNLYFDSLSVNGNLNWTLTGPAGTTVNQRSFTGSDWFTSLQGLLNLPAGNYSLAIDGSGDTTGDYSFRLLNLGDAEILTPGTAVSGTLSPHNETDAYRFAATAGDRFFFDVQTSTDMGNTAWRLLDSYGVEIFNQYFSDVDTRILQATGNYTLLVEGYYHDTGTGSYTINVQPIAPVVPQALTLGSTVNETIAVAGEQDVYQFTLAAAANLYFDSLSDDGNFNWTLTGPAGTTVNQRSFTGSDWFASLQGLLNLPAGDYTLTIDGSGDTTGDYSFHLLNLADAEILTPGTAVSGTLSPHNETDAYRFAATAGDRFFFDVQTSTDMGNTAWRLLDSYGVEIFNQYFSDVDTRILQATGNYTLLVEGYYHDTGTGSYTINVQPIAPVVPQALTLGSTVSEAIAVAGEQDVYQFTLESASNLYFDSLTNNGNLSWTLVGPAGSAVSNRSFTNSDRGVPLDELRLPGGDYRLTVDGSGDATGPYSFRLLDLAAATAITPGTSVSSNLAPAGETDVYGFTAAAGDRFYFDQTQRAQNLSNTLWRLLGPHGNEIFQQGFSDVDTLTLPVAGTYTLLVEGYVGDTGSSQEGPVLSGAFGAKAGSIGNDQTTALEVTLTVPEGDISFDRYVSSEEGFDFLRFFIDGVEQQAWSGEVPTSRVSFAVPAGTHTFRWEYSKDESFSEGEDTAWIDDITFSGGPAEGFESGDFGTLPWVLSGDANWSVLEAPLPNAYAFDVYKVPDAIPVDLSLSGAEGRAFTYDPVFNQLASTTDELGRQTLLDIDPANGNIRSITRVVSALGGPDDVVTQFIYTAHGLVDTATDPLGRVIDYDYDAFGRVTAITYATGTADEAVRGFEYADLTGNVTAVIDENGNRTEFEYDAMNRLTRVTEPDPDGPGPLGAPVTQFAYDARGNLLSTTDARNHTTQNQYDARDRLIKVLDQGNHETHFQYDPVGNLTAVVDPLGHRTVNRYDARNRLVETIDPDGGSTRFRYDADDNLVSVTDPVNNTTVFTYDARNRLIAETDPLGQSMFYGYDVANNLVEKTDRNGRQTTLAYDDLDRLITEAWVGGGNVIDYAYDKVANLTSVIDAFSSLAFTYDQRDRVRTVDNAGTPGAPHVVLAYDYDDAGNVLSVIDTINGSAGATTSYAYDALNRMTRINQTGSGLADKRVDLAYNPLGQFASIDRYSDLAGTQLVVGTTYAYDTLNRLTALTHSNTTDTVAFYNFTYDSASRITRIEDIDGVTDYAYDTRDQLVGADHSDAGNPDETYEYDANGNRISSSLHGDGYVTGPGNRLLSDGTYDYAYDHEGNMILRTEIATGDYREFTWDHRNRLVAVTDKTSSGTPTQEVSFSYDGLNRRISKGVDTSPEDAVDAVLTHFVYDREDVVLDFADSQGGGLHSATPYKRYLHGPVTDAVLAQEERGESGMEWLLSNHLGTINDVVSDVGTLRNHIRYDSFGHIIAQTDTTVSVRYGFTGREFNSEIDLYYYRARFYDAQRGRFISEDPIGFRSGDVNRYRYVNNSVLMARDPSGKASEGGTAGQCGEDFWTRVLENFKQTNEAIPGLLLPTGAGLLTAGTVAAWFGTETLLSALSTIVFDSTIGAIIGGSGASAGALLGSAALTALLNVVFVGGAFEGGIFVGSVLSVALDDLIAAINQQNANGDANDCAPTPRSCS